MSREALHKARNRRVAKAEAAAGVREGHYNLDGKFVRIWVVFYPSEKWLICNCNRFERGEDIPDTTQTLDKPTMARLENWL